MKSLGQISVFSSPSEERFSEARLRQDFDFKTNESGLIFSSKLMPSLGESSQLEDKSRVV